jgi:hypothetical protein
MDPDEMGYDLQYTLRASAWERAKGELKSMLRIQFPRQQGRNIENYKRLKNAIDDFIKLVEDEAMYEG